ncbi:MAG TPA: filamentous hemagglutinin N-terminal domain-containing protein, partial [Phycisphaerales bacterium]|nr:filamentous hemagglutinin N-terminal domain-containing protein [Phycisphaerales bacterium]
MHEFRALSVVGLLAFSAGVALAQSGPQGAEVVRGNVQIERNGANTVIRAGDRAIINYRSFDVASGELVRFVQPSANARVLNRITGGAPTRIDGSIQANGRVYFVNRAGIAFGAGSVVDAGRFYAIAGNITDRDFVRGVDRFTLTGSVSNEGSISAKDGVVLAGQTVTNAGTISSVDASAVMVAGGQVLVREGDGRTYVSVGEVAASKPAARRASLGGGDMLGSRLFAGEQTSQLSSSSSTNVTSTGTIAARQVHVESTGTTSVAGAIDTSNMAGAGGDVRVLGERVRLAADVDARGTTHGGDVLVGGNWQGGGDERRAQTTIVTSDATINTSGVGSGSAGTAVVWADGHTSFAGTMLAMGGEQGGDGAWIEVSGKDTLDFRGFANASAAKGENGTLLLDPRNITIINGGSGTLSGTGFNDNVNNDVSFDADAVTAVTNTGTNVILQANTSISVEEDIISNNPSGNGGDITLQSGGPVFMFNASIVTDGGDLNILINDSNANLGDRNPAALGQFFTSSSSINAGGGDVLIRVGSLGISGVNGGARVDVLTANRLTIDGGTSVSQIGDIVVNELLIQTSGPVTLDRAGNSIGKLAGDISNTATIHGTGAVTIDEISSVNRLRSTGAMTLDFGTILQNKPIDAPSLVATARSGGVLLPNISNTVA